MSLLTLLTGFHSFLKLCFVSSCWKKVKDNTVKIALVSSGLGNVWRGYERFTYDLFHLLKDEIDITLFKGGGEKDLHQVVVPHLSRDGFLASIPFLSSRSSRSPYYFEVLSFLLLLMPRLLEGGFDILHFTDCSIANFLYHFRTKFKRKFSFQTLFTNGNPVVDKSTSRVDFLHQLTPLQVEQMLDLGIASEKIIQIPFGVHCKRLSERKDKTDLRVEYGIPQDKIVVLAVSAINRSHKRIDYLVNEVSRLGPDYFLLVAGHMEDPSIEEMAAGKLKSNFKFMHVPFEKER